MATRDYRTVAPSALYGEIDPLTGRPRSQTGAASYTMPAPNFGQAIGHDDLLSGYERRNEGAGGILKGAAGGALAGSRFGGVYGAAGGALVGGIAGAATKNAKTAMTDFSDDDARSALNQAYQRYLGRPAGADEVNSQLAAQGYRADQGHEWVGESGLRSVLDSIQQSPEAALYARTGRPAGAQPAPAAVAPQAGVPTAGNSGFTGGSGALVDPYQLPPEADLEALLSQAQRYADYDASTGRIGRAGAASGAGGYQYGGFDFAQDAGNRDVGKSAKYAFAQLAEEAARRGDPQPRSKAEAEAWFLRNIKPGFEQLGYPVEWVQGDKARIKVREGWDEIDFLGNAGGENPTLTWQSELLAGGPQMSGGGVGAGGGTLPTSGMDLTSSALFEKLLAQAQAIASGQAVGASPVENDALLRLLNGGR